MNVPQHLAIILDGNGRWAKSKGKPRSYGHLKGIMNLEQICEDVSDLGIKYLTVYAFSTENWKRDKQEVDDLMKMAHNYLMRAKKICDRHHIQIKILGDITFFSQEAQDTIHMLEEYTKKYDELHFQIAMNYGSRDEITRGMRRLAAQVKEGKLQPEDITESTIESYLDTAGIPDPDLMIRTSGEQRISNYLLWQMAYTELYFTKVPWPAFDRAELEKAIEEYNARDRRYGGVK